MCIIVDANRLGSFLADPPNQDSVPVREWLDRGGSLVYSTGGAFAEEVRGLAERKLRDYVRDGRARLIPKEHFVNDERSLQGRRDRRSDDPHVLALARASGVRLLYTADKDLIADFKDKRFIDNPRGRVYSGAGNSRLLTRSVCDMGRKAPVHSRVARPASQR